MKSFPISILFVAIALMIFTACQPEEIIPEPPADPCLNKDVVAAFDVFNNNCKAPCELSFDNSSQNATSYRWEFDDGTTSSEGFPAHTYRLPGSYNITLIANDGTCQDTLVKPVSITWQTFDITYGLSGGSETGYSLIQLEDGDYVIGGETYNGNTSDIYLSKVSAEGILQWEQTFGGSESEYAAAMKQTADGGFIITGYTNSYGEDGDVYLAKTADNGTMQWEQSYGGEGYEEAYDVALTSDGGYIIVGETEDEYGEEDVYLLKVSANGDVQWQQTFGGTESDGGYAVIQAADGGFVLLGTTRSMGAGETDLYLIKTSSTGQKQWEETFGGLNYDRGAHVQQTHDGGYILIGDTESKGAGGDDVYLIKTSSSGSKIWERTYGGTDYDFGHEVRQTDDDGFILVGNTQSFGVGRRAYLLKTSADGTPEWERTFGKSEKNYGFSVLQTADRGYAFTGGTSSGSGTGSIYLVKTDEQGHVD